jgi:hypothetical protein
MGLSDPANGLLPETLLTLYKLHAPIEALLLMNTEVFVTMGIDRDQALMIRRIMKGKRAPEDVPATTGSTKMILELERRGVDLATRSMLRAVTKDLAPLQALTDANHIFELVAEDQLERIRPLLAPRIEYARCDLELPERKASTSRSHAVSAPVTRARGGLADMDAHARHVEIAKGTKELERSRRLLFEQERALHVQMELDRQEQIQRTLRQSQGDVSRLKTSEVCDTRGAREVPFGHGAMEANTTNREDFYQIGAIGGAGRMVSRPKIEQTTRVLRSWFQKSGVEGVKLTQLLQTCASEFLVCPQDLQDFHENGELAQLFPRRVLFHCVEHALRVNDNIPPKKTDATGMQRSTSLVGASRPAGDIWANNDKVVVVGDPAGGSVLSDPVAEAARADAYWRFEQIASSYPEFMPKVARTPKPLNFGLTQLTPNGERALRSNLASAYDTLLAPNTRTQMRDILQMGDANCTIMLDVGDRDVQGNVVLLERLVEEGHQVEAIISTTSLMIPLQTKRGEEWVRSGLPNFFWDIVINPTAALNAKGQQTGDPVRVDVRPLHGGHWMQSTISFMPGESSSVNAAKNPQTLGSLKWENDSLSIFHDKTKLDAGMQRFAIMHAQARALMVGMLKRDIQGASPQISDTQVLAEPAIAMYDECWKLMQRLEAHANGYYILFEASKKTAHPTASPFGPLGVMMKQTKQIVRLYNQVDQDMAAIASCQTRRAAAMMMRLSALRRLVEFMDTHSGRIFDLSAEMRATKGGNTLVKVDAKAQVEVSTPAAQATPKVAHASPSKGAGVVNTSTPVSSSWPRGRDVPPPNPLRIKAVGDVETAIHIAAKKVKANIKSQAGAGAIRLFDVRGCLKSHLHQALKDDGCSFTCLQDLRKEAISRGVHGAEVSVTLVKELMRNQEAHMASAMARAQQKYAPVPDKKRKEAAVTKGKNASPSPGPTKKVKKAREPGPQKKVSWASNRAKQGSSGGHERPSSEAEVPQFEDITDDAEAAATSGSNARERLDRSRGGFTICKTAHSQS